MGRLVIPMVALALALGGRYAIVACVSSDPATDPMRKPLEAMGFEDIQLDPDPFSFACGRDLFAQAFTARNARGKPVSGHVCCGALKACTVRF